MGGARVNMAPHLSPPCCQFYSTDPGEARSLLSALLQRVAGGWPADEERPLVKELASALANRLAPRLEAATPTQLAAIAE